MSQARRLGIALAILGSLSACSAPGGGDPEAARTANAARPPLAGRLAAKGLHAGAAVHIRIFKAESQLELWMLAADGRYHLFETYPICRWSGRAGPKLKEGDGQAPEGFYAVSNAQLNPNSKYHLAFNLGFPNAYDRARDRTGSALMVHGKCVSIGCYAMTDPAIDEIYGLVHDALSSGQTAIGVDALPRRFSSNDAAFTDAQWGGFWRDLAEGEQIFAATGRSPPVFVCEGRYRYTPGPNCQLVRAAG